LNPTFMESVWWVFKQLFDKGQVYRGQRVSWWIKWKKRKKEKEREGIQLKRKDIYI
jgi:isoleucyl-tRNA synthetase